MSDHFGFTPFRPTTVHTPTTPSTNPFDAPEGAGHSYGDQAHHAPEGLQGRPPSSSAAAPRQPMAFGGPHHHHHLPSSLPMGLAPDASTLEAIERQQQQTANNTALANATVEAQGAQGLNEFLKSMAELQAKSIKSSGEKLSGLG